MESGGGGGGRDTDIYWWEDTHGLERRQQELFLLPATEAGVEFIRASPLPFDVYVQPNGTYAAGWSDEVYDAVTVARRQGLKTEEVALATGQEMLPFMSRKEGTVQVRHGRASRIPEELVRHMSELLGRGPPRKNALGPGKRLLAKGGTPKRFHDQAISPRDFEKTSMTYGTLPSAEAFAKHFEVVCPDGVFRVGNDPLYGNHTFGLAGLWDAVKENTRKFTDDGDDAAGDWVSCVMSVLEFEWI
jgi:hypothetical protein